MNNLSKRVITSSILIVLLFLFFFYLPARYLSLALLFVLIEIIVFEWSRLISPKGIIFWLITPLYPVLPFFLLIALNESEIYRPLLLLLWTSVPLFDSGGYFFGKLFGKHKIAPAISPGKTWEGLIGGFFVTFLFFYALLAYCNSRASVYTIVCVTVTICLLAFFGDLFESWFKRKAEVKDSGKLLPGHGGFLDRFDSTLFVVIFFFIFKEYLIMLFNR